MASLLSGIILVLALALTAAAGLALLVGLFRVTGRRPAASEQSHSARRPADGSPARVS
jgi:uncharacterized membrane protein SpoIIM required for sporulation